MLPVWVYVVIIGVASNAFTFARLYKTAASRESLVASGLDNPALVFLYGRLNGNSVGALTAWRYGVWGALFAALMSVFLVVRHTRGDEEAGRLELVGSARVGRQAPLASAIAVAAGANAILVALLCLVLPVLGLPAGGSAALALAIGTCGLAFTGVSAVAAQLTSGARAARGLAIGALGVAFLARAVGDAAGASGPSWLTWVLPLGWTETLRPFAGERWWVLALPLALFLAGTWLAFALAQRRDLGAGLLRDRAGPSRRVSRAARPVRARVAAAVAGARGLGGRVRGHVRGLRRGGEGHRPAGRHQRRADQGVHQDRRPVRDRQRVPVRADAARRACRRGLRGIRGAAPAHRGNGGPRRPGPRRVGRARPVGAEPPRGRLAGTAVLLVTAGIATGLGYGLAAGGAGGETARMLGAALAQLPAAAVIVGIAALAYGAVPDACVAIAWTAVGLAVLLNIFGQAVQLSHWVLDVSPFTHVPRLPGGTVTAAPFLWLGVIALALGAAGLAALRRRDIG